MPPSCSGARNVQLWRDNQEVRLRRKSFEVLRYRVEHPGQLATKAMLLDAVWGDVAVADTMPAICVGELRRALGDEAKAPQFIETVHGRGYRFIAKVTSTAGNVRPSIKALVSCPVNKCCIADAAFDLKGGFGPVEGFGVFVPVGQEAGDGLLQARDTVKAAAANRLRADQAEPALD
jgi:DNA-binding winged helix-turn-helix (wHTH) protein